MSNLYEYIKMAVHNIMANKGRSFLTMLGIIIGIASVIAIVSVGEGTKNQMNSEIDDIGGGQIAISVSDEAQTDEEWITADDVEAIRAVDGIEGVNVSDSFSGETTTGKGNFSLMLTGEGPDAKLLNNATMKHGVYFGENEVQEAKNVCVLSDADAKRLFGTDDVVGMTVDVNCYGLTKSLRICGVTTQKENGTFVSYTYEGMPVTINVPYTTMNEFTGVSDYFFSVTMQTDKSLNSQDVADKVVKLMEKRHQCAGKDYFQVQSFQDIMSTIKQMLDMVTAFISFVAGISLLVGGIGVMNIMLVSVELPRIARAIGVDEKTTGRIIRNMMDRYQEENRGIQIIELENSFQMCTKKEYYQYLINIALHPQKPALSDVMLETLSIIAYKQPVTKAEIEKIRGVKCDHAINKLVEYSLVRELGRLDAPGRPILLGTTEEFLRCFGVQDLESLPVPDPVQIEDFKAEAEEEIQLKLDV